MIIQDLTVISAYSRAQAIKDGILVDLMQDEMLDVCQQHYKHPIACTIAVFRIMERAVTNPNWSNDYAGILHDMLWMSRACKRTLSPSAVQFRVKIFGAGIRKIYEFKLVVGPGDHQEPVITIMLPEED